MFWTRDPDAARGEQEFGMGVRFGRLTLPSQKMLAFLLAEKAERERTSNRAADGDDSDERTVVVTQEQLLASQSPDAPGMRRPAASAAPPLTEMDVVIDVPAGLATAAGAPEPELGPAPMLATEESSTGEQPGAELAPAWHDSLGELPELEASAPPRWLSRLRVVGSIAFLAVVAALIPMLFPKPPAKAAARAAVVTPLVDQASSPARPPVAATAATATAR